MPSPPKKASSAGDGDAPSPNEATLKALAMDLREKELVLREKELELKAKSQPLAAWTNPAIVGIFIAAIGLAGNAVVARINGVLTHELEQQRGEYARVLEMIKVGDPDQAAANLRMLLDSGLYTDHSGKLDGYLKNRKSGEGAFLPTTTGEPANTSLERKLEPASQQILENASKADAPWLKFALKEVGVKEIAGPKNNPRIVEYLKSTDTSVDLNDEISWNSAYLNWVFKQAGVEGTNSLMGKTWETWGTPIKRPRPGAIVIFRRGAPGAWSRHAGFYVGPGKQPNTIVVLGGNTFDSVTTAELNADRAVAFRWPESKR
ncbi:TIGR02594 family protein [Caulobacter vibrioides]|uniref:TIGR02594 family protein n=2 Tax=Caulobacter vibrioides TaxID=155892 RepID=Q9A3G4_CAUVC|nr:TIGR02594 family protein [Caulobacter vibrioides]YP_002518720.1 CHAP domain-containing protein [Caulobacter vibrioides NA1000]AAK25202.1 hypothetical protein CC_3240 [Caulobacter vibrioides CB15]ACL96812.1 CHAP domain-containing protein [Caulobacter vibrioides NA1000]ATC26122.1 TIGR02594 family protein [Caulobacter vibrioides]ATC30066.1 TIGR02594 family protein [Caulobacter vibrioides]AZH14262.1 TIGR02594 family protein [Caulobacter vibrioides]